jgi:DNA ligase 1
VSTVRKHEPEPEKWKEIKFMVFDGPLIKGNFQQRLKVLESKIAKDNKVVQLIKQTKCKSRAHLEEYMDEVCGKKGEGVMIKDLKSKYEHRRSYSLLKVKRFEDAEATVIGHNKGTGRCADMCGAIVVKEKDGTTFKIGSGFDDA